MRGSTTSSTGTAATIWASARRPTPAWAAGGSITPPTPKPFFTTPPLPFWTADAAPEDYLILQLRLRKGLDLAEYKARFGKEFSTSQLAFVKNCVKNGYASFDGRTLALTPAGLIVQNSILAELL